MDPFRRHHVLHGLHPVVGRVCWESKKERRGKGVLRGMIIGCSVNRVLRYYVDRALRGCVDRLY